MTKQDLKTGMLVQTRDKEIYLLVNGIFIIAKGGFMELRGYQNDLERENGSEGCDIMKVSTVFTDYHLRRSCWTEETINEFLLWSRESGFTDSKTSEKLPRKEEFDIESNTWTETKETS